MTRLVAILAIATVLGPLVACLIPATSLQEGLTVELGLAGWMGLVLLGWLIVLVRIARA